ncbi:lamin tail domain-containing protein [Clostridium sp. DJ247]|uniref:lamin tail domain-containing protein n=1 Tax=Clostridium sp. DJ247 TaxID=2726188 RepID=UPI001627836D|nr:lamin tail domain-containing protein [Clostridium sp. DJ247]MBC2579699.1 MBL fold metallo-hydrolase [Clostridium sp. DJ247]
MKIYKKIVGLLLGIVLSISMVSIPTHAAITTGQIKINEILPAPSSGSEWVELYNNTDTAIDIGDYYIDDIVNGGGSPYKIPAGTTIPARGFWTKDFSSYFNNGGDSVRILSTDGVTVLDEYSYGSTASDVSWYRVPNGGTWQAYPTSTPTKGSSNVTTGSGTWTPGNLEIHHIDVGQGDSTLVVSPTGKTLLIDAGETYWNSSADAQTVGNYIQSVTGAKNLDYVVNTHFHLDHIGYVGYGGLWNLVEVQGFTVGQFLHRDYNTYLGTTSGTFDNWKTYLEGAGSSKLHPTLALRGTSQINLGGNVVVDIKVVDGNGDINPGNFSLDLQPPAENDYSIGMLISYYDFDEWIGGDLDGQFYTSEFGYKYHDIERNVARTVGDVDVYRANHHGSDHSNSSTFVNQLDPEVSIISVGDDNSYGHPRQPVMNLLNATSQVYMTEHGDSTTNTGSAKIAGNVVVKTSNGINYNVNGDSYTATEPVRTDVDGDGFFAEVDSNDGSSSLQPQPNGGIDLQYQPYISPAVTSATGGSGSVTVSFNTAQDVDYYNLYRSTVNGGPYTLAKTNIPDSNNSWTDTGLTGGTTYYYVMTSVINGIESGYSNQVSAIPTSGASQLFISEYIEGSSNNKAIEIYNGTGSSVNLSGYKLELYFNGSTTPGSTINLSGTLNSNDVYVVSHSSASSTILAQADLKTSSLSFNGDDAIILKYNNTILDCIGQVGYDPGTEWGSGLTSTCDNTLVRKTGILTGDTNPSDAFAPSLEWNGFANDTFTYLGSY